MLDFPASPSVGQRFNSGGTIWVYDGTKWTATQSGGAISLVIGDVPPSAPKAGDLWWDTVSAQMFIWYDDGNTQQWVVVVNQGGSYYPLGAAQVIGDNRIINGDMRIDQRNNGASGTAAGYTVDRWNYGGSVASKGTWQRLSMAGQAGNAGAYCLGFTSSSAYTAAATETFYWHQPIEADFISDFGWGNAFAQPVTLSFWVSSTLTGTFSGALAASGGTRSYPFTFSIPVAATWIKIVVTIPGDTGGTWVQSGSGIGVYVRFDLGSGANFRGPANAWASANYTGATGSVSVVGTNGAIFNITGVKLEIGSVATPFNRQSLTKSLADCQRYYQTSNIVVNGYYVAGGIIYNSFFLPVQLRAAPTVAFSGLAYTNASALTTSGSSNTAWTAQLTVTATGLGLVSGNATFSAEL